MQFDEDAIFKDSMEFRRALAGTESEVDELEQTIKRLIYTTSTLFDNQEKLSNSNSTLADLITKLGNQQDATESSVSSSLVQVSQTIVRIESSRHLLIEQLRDTFLDPLSSFNSKEIAPVKKIGKEYKSARDEYDNALSKYMSKQSTSSAEAAEVANARKSLHIKALLYTDKLSVLESKRNFDLLESIVALVYAQFAFYHQGFELLKIQEPMLNNLAKSLSTMRSTFKLKAANSEKVTLKIKPDEYYSPLYSNPSAPRSTNLQNLTIIPQKSGYLFKKTIGALRTTWTRLFFELENDALQYTSENTRDQDIVQIDLRICMVRSTASVISTSSSPNSSSSAERKHTFELISPSRSLILQAESEGEMNEWIYSLQSSITRCLQGDAAFSPPAFTRNSTIDLPTSKAKRMSSASSPHASSLDHVPPSVQTVVVLQNLLAVPGNNKCADCDTVDNVEWASCNLGILLCITCSGIHRGLGRSISKVRSLQLDRWEMATLEYMKRLGNTAANAIFEQELVKVGRKEDISQADRAEFSRKKWGQRLWVKRDQRKLVERPAQSMFIAAVRDSDIQGALRAIALGATPNSKDLIGQIGLHLAVLKCDSGMTDFLISWDSDVNCADRDGKTPLHFAADRGESNLVILLLKRNAQCTLQDSQGRLPIDYALEKSSNGEEYVKIVTILRLTVLNKETRNSATWRTNDLGIEEALFDLKRRNSGATEHHQSATSTQQKQHNLQLMSDKHQHNLLYPNRAETPPPIIYAPEVARTSFERDNRPTDDLEKFVPSHFKMVGEPAPSFASDSDPWATSRWEIGTAAADGSSKKETNFADLQLEEANF